MGRTGRMLVGAALVGATLFVTPGTVSAQDNKPFTYGDCMSAVATGNFGPSTPQEFAQDSGPLQRYIRSQGNLPEDTNYIGCHGYPPPAPRP
jgi:hypothetical protein